eukprot:6634944-Pyramimonas_sp.AAC.1
MWSEDRAVSPTRNPGLTDASPIHRRCSGDASAMHQRRRGGEHRAPRRAAPPMHRRRGAILRPHLLGPHI